MQIRILLLSVLPVWLIASFTPDRGTEGICPENEYNAKADTSTSNRWLKVDLFRLDILPPSSGVQFYKDGIVFLSSSKSEGRMIDNHISFGKTDACYALVKDTLIENQRLFSSNLPFTFPCEATTFSSDYNTMYFTKYSEAEGVEKIYQAKYSSESGDQGNWSIDENPMSFCIGKSIYTHPALSADGKMMIFSSNRPETLGGMDLFVTQNKSGTWSDPVNLGDAINSRNHELYPYLDSENNLFFSSDGILGYGGYDIFVCKFKGNTWEAPVNLTPVNTLFDDVAFTIDRKDGKSAFYSIKEKSGRKAIKLLKITLSGGSGSDIIQNISQFLLNPATRNAVTIVTEPAVEATDRRVATDRSRGKEDNIVYRVQILTSFNPKTRPLINLEGKDYSVFEYLYSGAYRLCVGEFSTISPAIELRNKFIQNDYPQATVVVFRNNVRSFDPELLEAQTVQAAVPPAEKPVVVEPEKKVVPPPSIPEETKKVIAVPETKKPEPVIPPVKEPETKKPVTVPVTVTETAEKKDVVVYRVQIGTSNTSKPGRKVTINNKSYDTFEYFYAGAYRTCIGEFSTLAPAKVLQNTCRASGNSQAFVVAFKNNVRSTDPALFK